MEITEQIAPPGVSPVLTAQEDILEDDAEPPGGFAHRGPWQGVSIRQWNDWRWQLSHRLNTIEELRQVIRLTPEEEAGIAAKGRLRLHITPYFASLIDPDDPSCPLRRQVIPTVLELESREAMIDPLSEDRHSPVPGLVHRYPDRVLMLVTTQCASYCRYCTRSRIVGDPAAQFTHRDYDRQIDYIVRTPQVRDVLLSGGDPLMLAPKVLESLLERLRAIPHVEILRIGTRVPIFLPQRIDRELTEMLRRYHPLWVNIHVNHPKELTHESRHAIELLADAGIPLGCQTVLLAGINDCPNVMKKLMHELVKVRVRPYYLYQCDLVPGAGHFCTPVAKGIEIIEALRGHTSGFCIPTFAIDMPGGGGKVPIMPQYLISQSESRVVLRNYEGFISTYAEPSNYRPHDPRKCCYCAEAALGGTQEGVSKLLRDEVLTIEPEGFAEVHQRRPEPNVECGSERKEPTWQLVG